MKKSASEKKLNQNRFRNSRDRTHSFPYLQFHGNFLFFSRISLLFLCFYTTLSNICEHNVFSDRDLEKLYEQWEEDEEPLPVDELPEWDPRKPRKGIDLSDMSKYNEPEDFLKASKKGQSVMMFVRVSNFVYFCSFAEKY